MSALRTVNVLKSIVPISRFNKGEANKIFSEVKNDGIRIVVKNNVPECVLISPEDYQQMIEKYENSLLLAEAAKRSLEKVEAVSQNEVLKRYSLSETDLDDIDVELE